MSFGDNLPPAMRPFSRRPGSRAMTAADAERLLAGHGAHPEAPAVQQTLAGLLDIAAGPSSDRELAGEVAAIAAFMLVAGQQDTRPGPSRFRAMVRNRLAAAAGIGTAAVVAFSGAAAANALPAPVQELAHRAFDAPAPRHPAPSPQATLPSAKAAPSPSPPSPASPTSPATGKQHGKATATGKKTSSEGLVHGKAKGRKTVPPGHQKG
jgi:hypothetical protein